LSGGLEKRKDINIYNTETLRIFLNRAGQAGESRKSLRLHLRPSRNSQNNLDSNKNYSKLKELTESELNLQRERESRRLKRKRWQKDQKTVDTATHITPALSRIGNMKRATLLRLMVTALQGNKAGVNKI